MNFEHAPEFKKELKRLAKKWRSLNDDLASAQKVLVDLYTNNQDEQETTKEYRAAFFDGKRATVLSVRENKKEAVKMRLECVSLGKKDMLMLVFVYIYDGKKITFIELFSKSDKPREDKSRIKRYL